jgi:hypothetical protein
MNHLQELINNKSNFFKYMSNFFPVYYKSNIFLRDVQFAIKNYFDSKNIKLSYTELENMSKELMADMVKNNEASVLLEDKSWLFLLKLD